MFWKMPDIKQKPVFTSFPLVKPTTNRKSRFLLEGCFIVDGTGWDLEIAYNGKKITSHGSNVYPGGDFLAVNDLNDVKSLSRSSESLL